MKWINKIKRDALKFRRKKLLESKTKQEKEFLKSWRKMFGENAFGKSK